MENNLEKKHSGAGIASFVISIICILIYVLVTFIDITTMEARGGCI